MSVNTFAKIKRKKTDYILTIHDADTNHILLKIVVPSLKEALLHFDIENKEGGIEYGLQEVQI